jgi:GNAT superfamily N-acetyltransferase
MRNGCISYQGMQPGEEAAVCELVHAVFDRLVAPQFSQQGIDEFRKYVRPEALAERAREGHKVILAHEGDALLGMIEIREAKHISLLFVDEAHQGRGIGRELISRAFQHCHAANAGITSVTVHASPNSVEFYRRVGFLPEGSERVENGIRYRPMHSYRLKPGR